MKITILRKSHQVIVEREPGDPKFYGVRNAAGESRLLYHIKQRLNNLGYDIIKKRMWKDGHLVDDLQQYLRTRKPTGNPSQDIVIWNPCWAIHGAEHWYNIGSVTLKIEFDIFNTKVR